MVRGEGRGISGIFVRIMLEISRSRKRMREEFHKTKLRKAGYLRKKIRGRISAITSKNEKS